MIPRCRTERVGADSTLALRRVRCVLIVRAPLKTRAALIVDVKIFMSRQEISWSKEGGTWETRALPRFSQAGLAPARITHCEGVTLPEMTGHWQSHPPRVPFGPPSPARTRQPNHPCCRWQARTGRAPACAGRRSVTVARTRFGPPHWRQKWASGWPARGRARRRAAAGVPALRLSRPASGLGRSRPGGHPGPPDGLRDPSRVPPPP
jgi:hypothetical protein